MTTPHTHDLRGGAEGIPISSGSPGDVTTEYFAPFLAEASGTRRESQRELLDTLVEKRRDFWVELLSFPAPQARWIATLTRVANGELRHDGPTIFGGAESAQSVTLLLDGIRPLQEALGHVRCESTAASLRRDISMLLVAMPIHPETALSWANDVVTKSASLARLEERLTRRPTDFDANDQPSEADWANREALREELGGITSTVRSRVAELRRVRDAYLAVRDEIFNRHSDLVAPYAQWRRTSPVHDGADLTQEASIGLLRAIERAPALPSFPLKVIGDVRMTGQVKEFMKTAGQLVRVPEACVSAASQMRHGKANEDNTRFLRPEEVGAQMGLDSSNAQAIGMLTLPPQSLYSVSELNILSSRGSPDSQSPLIQLEAQESKERLRDALGALSAKDRLVIELRFGVNSGEEKTFKEIGDALGCSEPTAFRRVADALSKLRRRMSR